VIDTIFVPRGAEAGAVRRALARSHAPIRVVETGIGGRAAARAADDAIAAGGIHAALITGLCGLLSPAFEVGDTLVYHDVRRLGDGTTLSLDRDLERAVARRLPLPQTGIHALASDAVVTEARDKAELALRYGADAVDMESYALAELLQRAGVSVAAVRVASDAASDDLPALDRVLNGSGGIDGPALGLAMLRRPLLGVRLALNATRALGILRRTIAAIAGA
jgi:nucleoside phosphorylase